LHGHREREQDVHTNIEGKKKVKGQREGERKEKKKP
jgi:hypothetical protein